MSGSPEAIANRLGWLDAPDALRRGGGRARRLRPGRRRARALRRRSCAAWAAARWRRRSWRDPFRWVPVACRVRVLDSTDPEAVARRSPPPIRRGRSTSSPPSPARRPRRSLPGALLGSSSMPTHRDIARQDARPALRGHHRPDAHSSRRIADPGPRDPSVPRDVPQPADVGGRYSALTYVGLVPAALMGLDLARCWTTRSRWPAAAEQADASNPGLWLGAAMAALARRRPRQADFRASSRARAFGAWVEQLIAESTGKNGTGVVPDRWRAARRARRLRDDRVFVRIGRRRTMRPGVGNRRGARCARGGRPPVSST